MSGPKPTRPAFPAGAQPLAVPVPTGTRDMLPEEMAELRAISAAVLKTFADAGYGEVATPAFEYESTMRLAGREASENVYRVPDQDGRQLATRFDSTIPIARLAATRYHDVEPPLRFCYQQSVFRPVVPKRGQSREFLQVGMELLGLPAPGGDSEAIALLVRVLEVAGLTDFHIAVGDVRFFEELLDAAGNGIPADAARSAIMEELRTRDMVGLERELNAASGLSDADRARLISAASARGARDVAETHGAARLLELDELLGSSGVGDRVIYDLGLVPSLSYYTGTVLEIYVPSSGFPVGAGGRYDDLAGRFGRDLPSFGFAINMERLHLAVLAEQEGQR